jgi:hypothetical protein
VYQNSKDEVGHVRLKEARKIYWPFFWKILGHSDIENYKWKFLANFSQNRYKKKLMMMRSKLTAVTVTNSCFLRGQRVNYELKPEMHCIYKTSTLSFHLLEWGWCRSAKLILGFRERDTWQHILKLLQIKGQQIKKVINDKKERKMNSTNKCLTFSDKRWYSCTQWSDCVHTKWCQQYIIITTRKRSITFCSTTTST